MIKRFKFRSDRGLYRSRSGILGGVCRGVAEYFDLSIFWMRTTVVILFLLTGFWPIAGIYIIAYFLMKPEPVYPIRNSDEREFYFSYLDSRKNAVQRLKRRYRNIEHRIQRMEDTVTSREFNWDRKLNG